MWRRQSQGLSRNKIITRRDMMPRPARKIVEHKRLGNRAVQTRLWTNRCKLNGDSYILCCARSWKSYVELPQTPGPASQFYRRNWLWYSCSFSVVAINVWLFYSTNKASRPTRQVKCVAICAQTPYLCVQAAEGCSRSFLLATHMRSWTLSWVLIWDNHKDELL